MTKYENDQERARDEREMLRHSILGKDEPECPKCGSANYEQRIHHYDVTVASSPPDCTWWVCEDCGHETEPE